MASIERQANEGLPRSAPRYSAVYRFQNMVGGRPGGD